MATEPVIAQSLSPPPAADIAAQVRAALAEDVGGGDLTTALVDAGRRVRGRLLCREQAVVCGRPWADEVFRQLTQAA